MGGIKRVFTAGACAFCGEKEEELILIDLCGGCIDGLVGGDDAGNDEEADEYTEAAAVGAVDRLFTLAVWIAPAAFVYLAMRN